MVRTRLVFRSVGFLDSDGVVVGNGSKISPTFPPEKKNKLDALWTDYSRAAPLAWHWPSSRLLELFAIISSSSSNRPVRRHYGESFAPKSSVAFRAVRR
jgi:hypothetical protein